MKIRASFLGRWTLGVGRWALIVRSTPNSQRPTSNSQRKPNSNTPIRALCLAFGFLAFISAAFAECKVTESVRKFEGAERTIVTMENERIVVEVAPTLEGRIIRYADNSKPGTPI